MTKALDLDDSLFKGRQIKVRVYNIASLTTLHCTSLMAGVVDLMQVTVKRTNRPGISTTNRGRGRGRGRGMRGGFNPYFGGMMMMPMQPMYYRGGRGRAFR